jgi:DNA-binding IclR family transcriptional regulator
MKVRHDAADTSVRAAILAYPKAGTQRAAILALLSDLRHHPEGLTDAQIQWHLTMPESSERPRRVELVEAGWVEDSGRRRKWGAHAEAIVWTLTAAAREQVA